MSRDVRVAVLGTGRVAQHYKTFFLNGEIKNFCLVAVCDVNLNTAKHYAESFGCNSYCDHQNMFESEEIDLVFILTPSGCHYEHCKSAIKNGVNFLVEKPVTMLVDECLELERLGFGSGLSMGVAFQNRLNPAVKLVKNALDEGLLGKVITASIRLRWCRFQDYYDDLWHGTWSADGGVINQQAIHHIDALNWLVGPVASVTGKSGNLKNKLEAEDTFVAAISFENGAFGTIEATTAARPRDLEASLNIISDKGVVEIGGIALNKIIKWEINGEIKSEQELMEVFVDVPNGYGLSHVPLIQRTIDSIINSENKPVISLASALSTTRLVHALYSSEETKKWAHLDLEPQSTRLGRS